MSYYFTRELKDCSFEQALERTTEALKGEGFGVLTTIDMQATMKKKLDVEMPRYEILGACNPGFAHKALQAEDNIGLLLPCNVIVYEKGDAINVSVINPAVAMESVQNAGMEPLANEVRGKLETALAAI